MPVSTCRMIGSFLCMTFARRARSTCSPIVEHRIEAQHFMRIFFFFSRQQSVEYGDLRFGQYAAQLDAFGQRRYEKFAAAFRVQRFAYGFDA